MNERQIIGEGLESEGYGITIKSEDINGKAVYTMVYFSIPRTHSLVILSTEIKTIIPFESKCMSKFCKIADNNIGIGVKWSCKIKDRNNCRMESKCTYGGKA